MEARFAFAAQPWGDRAVICRAVEDRPGPVIEQQFGQFNTWTQAQNFAAKLNEGLDLDTLEVRQIVTSSLLATACVIQEALNSELLRSETPHIAEIRASQLRSVLAELNLALNFCHSAHALSRSPMLRALLTARNALKRSVDFLMKFRGDDALMEEVVSRAAALDASLQGLLSFSRLLERGAPRPWPDELVRHAVVVPHQDTEWTKEHSIRD